MKSRNLRAAKVRQRQLDERRQLALRSNLRRLAEIEALRTNLKAKIEEAKTMISIGEGAGAPMAAYRERLDTLHAYVARLDREADDQRRAAGLDPAIDRHLNEIGLEVRA